MTIEEMIKDYEIEPITYGANAGKIIVRYPPKNAADRAKLMATLPEIKKYLADRQAAEDAERARRDANVALITGLKEIEDLREALVEWYDAFNRSFDGKYACGGMGVGPKPEGDEKTLLKQYPQAAAYLRVKRETESANYELMAIGKRALNRFEDAPENWEKIVSDMDKEISEFSDQHAWD